MSYNVTDFDRALADPTPTDMNPRKATYGGGWLYIGDCALRMSSIDGVMPLSNMHTDRVDDHLMRKNGTIVMAHGGTKFWCPNDSREILEWLRLNGEIKS